MSIQIKRAYDPAGPRDGLRVLVDRLWPRGISRDKLKLDAWMKELAPSNELRKWFHHDVDNWAEFEKRYFKELDAQAEQVEELRKQGRRRTVTLLYGARDETHNNAVALKKYLERKRR